MAGHAIVRGHGCGATAFKQDPTFSGRLSYAPIEIVGGAGALHARVTCNTCDVHRDVALPKVLPAPPVVRKRIEALGWIIRKRAICPTCSPAAKRKATPMNTTLKPITQPVVAPAPHTIPIASDAAKRTKRLVFQALEDAYDDVGRKYRPGHSDETVAKETTAAIEFVRQIREADFGPIEAPNELQLIHCKAIAIAARQMAVSHDLDRLHSEFAALCKSKGWRIPT